MTMDNGLDVPDDLIERLQGELCNYKERCTVLRSWIHQVDWDALCRAQPDAKNWFNSTGLCK